MAYGAHVGPRCSDAMIRRCRRAYRIVLKLEQINDPKLREMVQTPGLRFWAGPDAHVVAYSIRGGNMYNFVLLVPDDLEEGVARTAGNVEEMKKFLEEWDPV
jgi:salicylate hydroxylase